MHSLRYRNRLREIDSSNLIKIKEEIGFTWKEIDELLGIKSAQRNRYLACGRLPADRYYAFQQALLLAVEEEGKEKRDKIMQLFSSTSLT